MTDVARDLVVSLPRWAWCATDRQLHLLEPAAVSEVVAVGAAPALCGRLIVAEGLTIGQSGAPCVSCLAAGTASGAPRGSQR